MNNNSAKTDAAVSIPRLVLNFVAASILCIISFTGCNEEDKLIIDPEVERIVGFYEAIKWTDIGSGDWQVDMLVPGSSLTAQLAADFKIAGHIFIPTNTGSSHPPMDQDFTGTFTLIADTLRFQNTGDAFLDFLFLVKGDSLETVDLDGPSGVFKLIMEKK